MDNLFGLFRRPDIDKLAAQRDIDGLYRVLQSGDAADGLRAAAALARLEDGAGWRWLDDALRPERDPAVQAAAAELLAELAALGPHAARRAAGMLENALRQSSEATRGPLRSALAEVDARSGEPRARNLSELSGPPELPQPVYRPGFIERLVSGEAEPLPDLLDGALPLPNTSEIGFLSAETHLNNAADLREAELAERGLVEATLALWLQPDWPYANYLRGVLYEDLERPLEAALAYRAALRLDSALTDAREALEELELPADAGDPAGVDLALAQLLASSWSERRDAAALLGEAGNPAAMPALLPLLEDDEREVRHAALVALARLGAAAGADERAAALEALEQSEESSWLLQFAVLDALTALRSAAGLHAALLRKMQEMSFSVFEAQRDPLHQVEYERMMEIGALAFARSGDLPGLLDLAEANAWELLEEDEAVFEAEAPGEQEEEDADLSSYVDEVALMACTALERLAAPRLDTLETGLLERLAAVPDLTLLDYSTAAPDGAPQRAVAYDLAGLRAAAARALGARR